MTKLGDRLIAAAREGRAIARGEADPASYKVFVPTVVDVRAIRKALNLSQDQFALRFGLSAATVRDWEQNRREPEGAARVLLQVIKKEPEAVSRALAPPVREIKKRPKSGSISTETRPPQAKISGRR
jgi:putative transcriptional regulator